MREWQINGDKTAYWQANRRNCINIRTIRRAGWGCNRKVLQRFYLPCLKNWRKWAGHTWCGTSTGPAQLAQWHCDNILATLWLMLSQRCGKIKNESCGNASFRRCDSVVQGSQDVSTTLLHRCYNINQWFCWSFLITDNFQLLSTIKT